MAITQLMNAVSPGALPAFDLPPALQLQGYRLRPETDADIPFLMALYASTREEELAPVPWTPEQKAAFCAQQFAAQRKYYYETIKACRFMVIERHGEAVGRLYLEEKPMRLHIVDIALLPQRRGMGLGTAVLEALHEAGSQSGRPVSIMVDKFGRALHLYRRLGYVEITDYDAHIEMEWTSPGGLIEQSLVQEASFVLADGHQK